MPEVANSHQATDHNYEAEDRSKGGCPSAPTGIYPGLDDHQIEQPGHRTEYLERSPLPVDLIARVRVPQPADDTERHQHKPDGHGARANGVTGVERWKLIEDRSEALVLQLALLKDVHHARAK